MRTTALLVFILSAAAVPALAQTASTTTATAQAATVDPAQIPDGTYTATVEKVIDNKHVMLRLQNGMRSLFTTVKPNVDFSKIKTNDQIKLSVIKGLIAVYAPVLH